MDYQVLQNFRSVQYSLVKGSVHMDYQVLLNFQSVQYSLVKDSYTAPTSETLSSHYLKAQYT